MRNITSFPPGRKISSHRSTLRPPPVGSAGKVPKITNTQPNPSAPESPVFDGTGESMCIIFHAFPAGQVIFCPTTKYKRKGFQKSSHILHTVVLISYTIFVILNNLHKQAVFSSVQSKKLSPNNRREFFFPIVYFHIRASRSPAFVLPLIDTGTAPPAAV